MITDRLFKKKKTDFKPWHLMLLVGIAIVAAVLGIMQRVGEPKLAEESLAPPEVILNAETCRLSGGTWNECGSACRMYPDMPCIDVCVEYCECSSDNDCPYGLSCLDYVNDIGVCQN